MIVPSSKLNADEHDRSCSTVRLFAWIYKSASYTRARLPVDSGSDMVIRSIPGGLH